MFDWITKVIAGGGYAGVAALTFLENVFPPLPSELVIPLAGFVAAQGDLRLAIVVAAATLGSLAGASAWYEVGRRVGEQRFREWVKRHGKWLTIGPRDVDQSADWFRRHGKSAVLIGRVIPGVRTFISLPAGFTHMARGPFLLYSAAGTFAWTVALAYAGVVLRSNYAVIGDYIDIFTYGLLVVIAGLMARRYINCWRESR